jgi:hypothetical protein
LLIVILGVPIYVGLRHASDRQHVRELPSSETH